MAKLETIMSCNFEPLVARIEKGILDGSISASLEDKSDFIGKTSRGWEDIKTSISAALQR